MSDRGGTPAGDRFTRSRIRDSTKLNVGVCLGSARQRPMPPGSLRSAQSEAYCMPTRMLVAEAKRGLRQRAESCEAAASGRPAGRDCSWFVKREVRFLADATPVFAQRTRRTDLPADRTAACVYLRSSATNNRAGLRLGFLARGDKRDRGPVVGRVPSRACDEAVREGGRSDRGLPPPRCSGADDRALAVRPRPPLLSVPEGAAKRVDAHAPAFSLAGRRC